MSVVTFPKPKGDADYIFVCQCGCASFELRGDGEIVCRNCRDVMDDTGQRQWFKSDADLIAEKAEYSDSGNNDSGRFAERSIKRAVAADETSWIIAGDDTGRVRSWSRTFMTDDENKDWLRRGVDIGLNAILEEKPE